MLVAVAVVAVMCGLFFGLAETEFLRLGIQTAAMLLFVVFVGFAVYDQSHARAFSVGALLAFVYFGWRPLASRRVDFPGFDYATLSVISVLIITLCGLFTLLMFHFSRRTNEPTEPGRFSVLLQGLITGLLVGAVIIATANITTAVLNQPPPSAPTPLTPFRTHGGVI